MKQSILLSLATFFVLSFVAATAQENGNTSTSPAAPATAQEERLTIETRDKETPAMRGLKLERPFRRAVPQGYGPVVDTTQREQIYKIQEEYFEAIALLELRVELLKKERDAKIEGVLTPTQLERLRRPAPVRNLLGR